MQPRATFTVLIRYEDLHSAIDLAQPYGTADLRDPRNRSRYPGPISRRLWSTQRAPKLMDAIDRSFWGSRTE
jgi:hypothetical protein